MIQYKTSVNIASIGINILSILVFLYIYFSIKDYRHELTIEQPSLVNPGKPISATGEWHDEAHLKVQSDLITITQIYGDEVIEQKGC